MKKILIALSGGVDSSVAAGITANEYEAVGATMKLYCSKETDLRDAENIFLILKRILNTPLLRTLSRHTKTEERRIPASYAIRL